MQTNETPNHRPAMLRTHLELAAEARRRGDHAAANLHETDALVALRATLATTRAMEASNHG